MSPHSDLCSLQVSWHMTTIINRKYHVIGPYSSTTLPAWVSLIILQLVHVQVPHFQHGTTLPAWVSLIILQLVRVQVPHFQHGLVLSSCNWSVFKYHTSSMGQPYHPAIGPYSSTTLPAWVSLIILQLVRVQVPHFQHGLALSVHVQYHASSMSRLYIL
ncbi:hypothetical protein CHS0354_028565 [Potamilus streckersoni]|uniref:Uncharacterized protein n=1 Tax=Potamilus streckersoni TaxID=2493646 RepID=A0AAE0SNF2_9BIVA|nr:hypothetical protein CHS0354_028565 [Potamilus streckersoni]